MSKESREKADEKGQKSGKQSSIIPSSKRYLLRCRRYFGATMDTDSEIRVEEDSGVQQKKEKKYDVIKSSVLLIIAIMFTGLSLIAIPYSLLYSGVCILIALSFSTYAVSNL